MLPQSPPNTVPLLAIDSALPRTYAIVAAHVAVAGVAVILVRVLAPGLGE